MLNALKRWISGSPSGPDWAEVSAWAQKQGLGFKRVKDEPGFVLDGRFGQRGWRLEWGAPQRAYIATHELRLRIELQLPQALQMLVMSRPLMETLERETFERYTESNQTLIDVSTPEEMRWLAMFPKAPLDLPKSVRGQFGAVSGEAAEAVAWVDAAVGQQLAAASLSLLRDSPPFVLMSLRGRLYMRVQLDEPGAVAVAHAVSLFEAATESALRVAAGVHETAGDFPSTSSTAWATELAPEDPKDHPH